MSLNFFEPIDEFEKQGKAYDTCKNENDGEHSFLFGNRCQSLCLYVQISVSNNL